MKIRTLLPALLLLVSITGALAQFNFTNKSSLLGASGHYSGVTMAVMDMNGDGLDDIIRLDQGKNLNIQYQGNPNENFISKTIGALPGTTASQWGMCTADIDNNGYGDILAGGRYDGIKIGLANADGTGFNFTNITVPNTFVQGVNFADVNNDGKLDAFVCHDDGVARIFGNNGDGTFTYRSSWINLATVPTSDNSGNYGSVWSDVDNDGDSDLYIAHCRQGVNSNTDPRRINQLFLRNANSTFTQDITNASGLRIGAQSWTADFGDIDNDGDLDCFITNHDVSSQLLLNDGAGHFTDITAAAGMLNAVGGTPIQGVFRDFDNDGYVDILVAGTGAQFFKNNGDKTFSRIFTSIDLDPMESFAIGDLNNDGFQDVYAGYAHIYTSPSTTPDALWMNSGNNNHFFGLNLRGVQSNRGGIGAKVQLYSSLGIQTREAHAGESYGISNSPLIHFGMGQVETIDSVVVKWPSGLRQVIYNPLRDQYATLIEGGCFIPSIRATALGSTILCPGESVDIQVPAGYQYLWNTGDTTQTITVKETGEYRVTITSAFSCSVVSNSVAVTADPALAPQISASGDTILCAGSILTLSAPASLSYQWNNGATTQSIQVGQAGEYSVTTQGYCALLSSSPVHVHVLSSPIPGGLGVGIPYDSTALLNATGIQQNWYNVANGGSPIPDPFLSHTAVPGQIYYVSNTTTYDQPNEFTGMTNHQGSIQNDLSYNGGLIFDCFTPFKLAKVKVYAAVEGERKVDLLNSNGQLLASQTVFIPSGVNVIDLNMEIPTGANLVLTTDAAINQANLGSVSPQLRRSTQGCAYPYAIDKYLSIKNSTIDQTRYFYFFDWEVDFHEYLCESPRMQIFSEVNPSTAVNDPAWTTGVEVFPNPASDRLTVRIRSYSGAPIAYSLRNAQGINVLGGTADAAVWQQALELKTGHLPKGMYWLELTGESGMTRKAVAIH